MPIHAISDEVQGLIWLAPLPPGWNATLLPSTVSPDARMPLAGGDDIHIDGAENNHTDHVQVGSRLE
jgi:hypothetical protein